MPSLSSSNHPRHQWLKAFQRIPNIFTSSLF